MTLTTVQTQKVLDTIANGAAEFFPGFAPGIIAAEKRVPSARVRDMGMGGERG